jgi:hypothetical protein
MQEFAGGQVIDSNRSIGLRNRKPFSIGPEIDPGDQ